MKKVPAIRFPEFSGKWIEKRLGELNIYISDGNYGELYPTSKEFVKEGIPFIRANNIKDLKIINEDMKYISEEKHQILTSGHLKCGDILVTTRGEIGEIAYVDKKFENANINAQICLLRTDNKTIYNKFLLYQLVFNKKQFLKFQTGSALKQLPKKYLKKIKIFLPPTLSEQEKIANFLSAIDEKIEIVSKKIEKLKLYKKGLLQKMLNVTKNGEPELRFKGFSGKWVEKKLKDICKFEKGTSITSNNITKGNIPVIAGGKEPAYYHNQYNREGDIITVSSSGANAGFVNYFECPIFASDCFTIQGLNKLAITKFIFYILKLLQNKIFLLQSGGAQPHIYIKDLNTLKIHIPPTLAEQQKIVDFLSNIDKKIEIEENRLTKLKEYKKGLLQKMFV